MPQFGILTFWGMCTSLSCHSSHCPKEGREERHSTTTAFEHGGESEEEGRGGATRGIVIEMNVLLTLALGCSEASCSTVCRKPGREELGSSSFHRWANRGTERLRSFSRVYSKHIAELGLEPNSLVVERASHPASRSKSYSVQWHDIFCSREHFCVGNG